MELHCSRQQARSLEQQLRQARQEAGAAQQALHQAGHQVSHLQQALDEAVVAGRGPCPECELKEAELAEAMAPLLQRVSNLDLAALQLLLADVSNDIHDSIAIVLRHGTRG